MKDYKSAILLYFSAFSSAVPFQDVPSSTQAFHDSDSRVAVKMSCMVCSFKGGSALTPGAGPPEEFPGAAKLTVPWFPMLPPVVELNLFSSAIQS